MTKPMESKAKRSMGRRLLVAATLSVVVFAVLWIWSWSLMMAALIASAPGIVIVLGSFASDAVDYAVEAVAGILMFALNIVGVVISAIFDMFD